MVKSPIKKIVILGAGFAGLNTALLLARKIKVGEHKIILIDKSPYHLYTPDLYEIATAFSNKITDSCELNLKKTVTTPFKQLVANKNIQFINDEVLNILPITKEIQLKKTKLRYDYLMASLGSETDYYNIPGLKENSFTMKTANDAIKLNCHIDQYFKNHQPIGKCYINVVGGGATGVETIAELVGYLNKLSKKYSFKMDNIKVQLIEGHDTLAGFDKKNTNRIKSILRKKKINIFLNSLIKKVSENEISLQGSNKKLIKIKSDILIWTGGVKVNKVIADTLGEKTLRGKIKVNSHFESTHYENIFAAGDNAHLEIDGHIIPMLAQEASKEAKIVAQNIYNKLKGKPLKSYKYNYPSWIMPLGGKNALLKTENHLFEGRWCWYLRRIIALMYTLNILPFFESLKRWFKTNKIYIKND